jgi:glycerol uptake facilitator-like aquaporin
VKTIFDLPAHPLFVHVPLVLLPLIAIVTIVAAARPSVARRLGIWLPIASLLVFVSVLLATNTGEALDKAQDLGNVKHHRALAETTRLLSFVLLLATVALWWINRRRTVDAQADRQRPLAMGVAAVTVVFAVLSAVWVIRTGHEGARVHWSGVLKTR